MRRIEAEIEGLIIPETLQLNNSEQVTANDDDGEVHGEDNEHEDKAAGKEHVEVEDKLRDAVNVEDEEKLADKESAEGEDKLTDAANVENEDEVAVKEHSEVEGKLDDAVKVEDEGNLSATEHIEAEGKPADEEEIEGKDKLADKELDDQTVDRTEDTVGERDQNDVDEFKKETDVNVQNDDVSPMEGITCCIITL